MLRPASAKAEWTVVSWVLIWWMFGEDVPGVELGRQVRKEGENPKMQWMEDLFFIFGTGLFALFDPDIPLRGRRCFHGSFFYLL